MSYDDSSTQYHLTTRGWETGEPPQDRVETWERSSTQASGWSRNYISWRCLWVDQGISPPQRDVLRAKHKDFIGSGRDIAIGEPL